MNDDTLIYILLDWLVHHEIILSFLLLFLWWAIGGFGEGGLLDFIRTGKWKEPWL